MLSSWEIVIQPVDVTKLLRQLYRPCLATTSVRFSKSGVYPTIMTLPIRVSSPYRRKIRLSGLHLIKVAKSTRMVAKPGIPSLKIWIWSDFSFHHGYCLTMAMFVATLELALPDRSSRSTQRHHQILSQISSYSHQRSKKRSFLTWAPTQYVWINIH